MGDNASAKRTMMSVAARAKPAQPSMSAMSVSVAARVACRSRTHGWSIPKNRDITPVGLGPRNTPGELTKAEEVNDPRQVILRPDDVPLSPGLQQVADQLRAAKPLVWRGPGDLMQFNWAKPLRGSWLVIDLWAGCSGLCLALGYDATP